MTPFRPITKRDVFLILFGASSMYIWSSMFTPSGYNNTMIVGSPFSTDPPDPLDPLTDESSRASNNSSPPSPPSDAYHHSKTPNQNVFSTPDDPLSGPPTTMTSLPHTSIVAHAPGWTIFRNLYMANGTLLVVSPDSVNAADNFPQIRMMTSPGYPAENTPDDIQRREPTADHMDFITPEQADFRWKISSSDDHDGPDNDGGDKYRVWSIKGNTILFNDPSQFIRHFYHFVAELFFGMWAFWFGAFTPSSPHTPLSLSPSSLPPPSAGAPHNPLYAPPIHRMIFAHSDIDGWHDNPGFDAYFFRAAFPSLAVEDQRAWQDRILATTPRPGDPTSQRAWHFPLVLITDRSAAFKGRVCGSLTQRTAAEAWQYMIDRNQLLGVHAARWWDPIREAVWRFASVDGADAKGWMKRFVAHPKGAKSAVLDARGPEDDDILEVDAPRVREGAFQYLLPSPETITLTYISRQRGGRRLTDEAHEGLVTSLNEMVERRREKGEKWEFKVVYAERMSKDEQVRMAASTTILLGVHGNGLTHLVFMPPTRLSTVIEIFYPGGFAHDYHWTSTAMGMRHFAVWNDTYHTLPDEPPVNYPDGFQSKSIPVHGPSVAKMIEDRVDGKV